LVILGITATQLACFKTPEGIWFLEAIFWTTCAAAFSIFDASAAKAKVVTKTAKPSIAHVFFIRSPLKLNSSPVDKLTLSHS